jgi:hypothetical protein
MFNNEILKLKFVKICLMIKIKFKQENCYSIKILFCLQQILQSTQHFYNKREGSGSVLVTSGFGCGSGMPKKNGSYGSGTLLFSLCHQVNSRGERNLNVVIKLLSMNQLLKELEEFHIIIPPPPNHDNISFTILLSF